MSTAADALAAAAGVRPTQSPADNPHSQTISYEKDRQEVQICVTLGHKVGA